MDLSTPSLKDRGNYPIKGQSAMEYLTTYGWSILIIAIVLAALLSLGSFNGPSVGTSCLALSGFSCTSAIFIHGGSFAGGNILVSIGQSSGTTYTQANVAFLNSSNRGIFQSTGAFPVGLPTNAVGIMVTGISVPQIYIPASSNTFAGTPLGSTINGQIWVRYVLNGVTYYSEVAIINGKAS